MDKKELNFNILLTVPQMYDFLLRHTYTSFAGVFGLLLSLGAFILLCLGFGNGDTTKNIILVIITLLFTVVSPLQLFFRAKQQITVNPMFKKPLHYEFSEKGIMVSQGEQKNEMEWEQVRKIVATKKSVMIYMSKINAYILPKSQMKGQYELLKDLFRQKVPDVNNKLK